VVLLPVLNVILVILEQIHNLFFALHEQPLLLSPFLLRSLLRSLLLLRPLLLLLRRFLPLSLLLAIRSLRL